MKSLLENRGRVLVVGAQQSVERATAQLSNSGFVAIGAESASAALSAADELRPEAILVTDASGAGQELLAQIRVDGRLAELPVLADVSLRKAKPQRPLDVDEWVYHSDDLTIRVEAALKAKRVVDHDLRLQRRMELLLEITQAASSSLEVDDVLRITVDKIAAEIDADRCSVVLVEGDASHQASVVASYESPELRDLKIDLARYPELRRALETRQMVHVQNAARDPLMKEVWQTIAPLAVKSILVQPLISQDEMMGALFLRVSRADGGFGREEQEFVQAVAAALSNSLRNARMHQALKKKREELESAYVDRYRELIEANQRLKDLARLKDEMLAVCSHDLRAPLQVLLGHGRLLIEGEVTPQQRASAEAITRQGRKILELVESLLERGKGEQARVSLEARLLDLSDVCHEIATELEILAAEKGVALRAETSDELLAIADPVKLHEVLQNLVTNAIHHAKEAGEVVVRAEKLMRPDGEVARLVVQDDGHGISPDELPLVFDRYRHGPGGTGLGLAICKEFVELHGGEIWAESPPSGGCSFVITLPLAKSEMVEKVTAPRERLQQARVLVVEDEPEVASVLTEILRSRYRVDVARDGAEGLAKARATKPDLVVMDVFLPKMDGLDAAVALKSSGDTADVPVILLSAHQGVADKVRALNLGAVDYMGKPFQALELLARTERALQLRFTERELVHSQHLLRRVGKDPVTGLLDRQGMVTRLEQELSRSRRYGRPLCAAIAWTEPSRPERVRDIARLLRDRLRTPDVIAHLGDGTFGLLLPECTTESGRAVLARLKPMFEREIGFSLEANVIAPDETQGAEELVDTLATLAKEAPKHGSKAAG
jgi:two-component system sensor histidine kinase ChiS